MIKFKQFFTEDKNPDIEKGDTILTGRYKNSPAIVKGFGKDKKNQPTVKTKEKGTLNMYKFRIKKLMKEALQVLNEMPHQHIGGECPICGTMVNLLDYRIELWNNVGDVNDPKWEHVYHKIKGMDQDYKSLPDEAKSRFIKQVYTSEIFKDAIIPVPCPKKHVFMFDKRSRTVSKDIPESMKEIAKLLMKNLKTIEFADY